MYRGWGEGGVAFECRAVQGETTTITNAMSHLSRFVAGVVVVLPPIVDVVAVAAVSVVVCRRL